MMSPTTCSGSKRRKLAHIGCQVCQALDLAFEQDFQQLARIGRVIARFFQANNQITLMFDLRFALCDGALRSFEPVCLFGALH